MNMNQNGPIPWDSRADKTLKRHINAQLTQFKQVYKLLDAYCNSEDSKSFVDKNLNVGTRSKAFITPKA